MNTRFDLQAKRSAPGLLVRTLVVILTPLGLSQADGSQPYAVLKNFSGGPNDGALSSGSVTIGGSAMYGMTAYGGASPTGERGIVFKMNTDGSGFALLHRFVAGANDG